MNNGCKRYDGPSVLRKHVGAPLKGAKSLKNRSDTAEYVLHHLREMIFARIKELDCDKQSSKRVRRSLRRLSSHLQIRATGAQAVRSDLILISFNIANCQGQLAMLHRLDGCAFQVR